MTGTPNRWRHRADIAARRAEHDYAWASYTADNEHARTAYHRRMAYLEQVDREDQRVNRANRRPCSR